MPGPDRSEPWHLEPEIRIEPGTRLGPYLIGRPLGSGGMGLVFEALQDEPARLVAIKAIHLAGLAGPDEARFRSEVEALGRVRHPGIAVVHQAGVHRRDDGVTFGWIAMELIPSARPLTAHARAAGLDRRARLGLFLEVCDAVAHAHRHGIIHRDLKPSNLLVGEDGRVRVIDFGIASLVEAGGDPEHGDALEAHPSGTPGYAAPEQRRTTPTLPDVRLDVHALGVILDVLMTGRLPELPSAGPGAPAPRDLEAIAAKATAEDPEARYRSVQSLADDVRAWLGRRPVRARPRSRIGRAWLSVRRRPVHWVAGAAVFAAIWSLVARAEEHKRAVASAAAARDVAEGAALHARLTGVMYEADPGLEGDWSGLAPIRGSSVLLRRYDVVMETTIDTRLEAEIATGEALAMMVNGLPGRAVSIMHHVAAAEAEMIPEPPWDVGRCIRLETLARAQFHFGDLDAAAVDMAEARRRWEAIGGSDVTHLARVFVNQAEIELAAGRTGAARRALDGIEADLADAEDDRSHVRERVVAVLAACDRLEGRAISPRTIEALQTTAARLREVSPAKPTVLVPVHLELARQFGAADRPDEAIAAIDAFLDLMPASRIRNPLIAQVVVERALLPGGWPDGPAESERFKLAVNALEFRLAATHPTRVALADHFDRTDTRPMLELVPAMQIAEPVDP